MRARRCTLRRSTSSASRASGLWSFGLPKTGNILFPGYDLGGKLYVSHTSFPPGIYDADTLKIEINPLAEIPPRDKDGHKGDFGQALFVAGAAGYFGAPYFSALPFLKAGGGYSRLAAPRSVVPFIGSKGSGIVFIPQAETDAGSIALQNKPALLELSERMDMVIVGPGLSLDPETQRLARELTAEIDKPPLPSKG
jgi:NAD(P)H-hydrate repair Nnr-like enzyme with NAD(P)H-hydrate dehydratase domain